MGVISSLTLENFQSHKESKIVFDKGLTVIIGQTDQGKSAIIRALKWVLYNEPRGTDFITAGYRTCRVSLEMNDGTIITRERDGNRNRYILIREGNEQIFEGFGHNIPLEIIKAHGIPKVHIDVDTTSMVNLAEQLEAPFLVSENGSNRAKALGRLIGIHIIDAAQRATLKDIIDAENECKLLESDINLLKKELTNFEDIDILAKKISKLKEIIELLKHKRVFLLKLSNIKKQFEPTIQKIKETHMILSNISFIEKVESLILTLDILYTKYYSLHKIKDRLRNIDSYIRREQNIIILTQRLVPAEDKYYIIVDLYNNLRKIMAINTTYNQNKKYIEQIQKTLDNTRNVSIAEEMSFKVDELIVTIKKYSLLNDQWKSVKHQSNSQAKELKKYDEIGKAEEYFDSITKQVILLSSLKELSESLKTVESSIKKGETYLQKLIDNLSFMAKKYGLILDEFSICPTCLKPIDNETTQRIIIDILN
ncbi:MAG: AAA family ATPase [Tepidanaerobacteraceae bacterium]|nr:AAA family ATPase [Thermoanaerobacterales bacterium]